MSVPEPAAGTHGVRRIGARRAVRAGVQVAGFAVGIGLLWWCVKGVLKPENRAQLERLGQAPAGSVAALALLGAATVLINGAVFHAAIRPVRRLRWTDVQAVNAVAALLALLPFKLSVLFRVLVHNRRDRVPVLTIAAWLGAVSVSMAAVLVPALVASRWRGRLDAPWWSATLGGTAALTVAAIVTARLLSDGPGWAWVERTGRRLPVVRALLPRMHEGLRMLSHPGAVAACVLLRMADAGVHALRLLVAASILGVALPVNKAVIGGASYFIIGAASPTGQVGTREAGTAAVLAGMMHLDPSQLQLVVLLVSATEASVLLLMAVMGGVWLRLWKGVGGAGGAGAPAAGDAPAGTGAA